MMHRMRNTLLFSDKIRIRVSSSSSILLSLCNSTTAYVHTSPDDLNLTISYLNDVCGLPLKVAVRNSKYVNIRSTQKPDSVLSLLRSHGFTDTYIVKLVTSNPRVLLADPDNNLRPKFQYFESLGISGPSLQKTLCYDTWLLNASLKKQIIPNIDFLRKFLHTNENLAFVFKQSSRIVRSSVEKIIAPNIATLRAQGVSDHLIKGLMMAKPGALTSRVDRFEEAVKRVTGLGFSPTNSQFVLALACILLLPKEKWERKKELLMSFGWSEKTFSSALKVQPLMMWCSEEKIADVLDFLVNTVKMSPPEIAKNPNLFLISLKRRAIPRCAVLQVLMLKGLIKKKNLNLAAFLCITKTAFEKKYLRLYMDSVPEVMKAYNSEVEFQGLPDDCQPEQAS